MSTVIECPECSTRYKMNKAIPEGGRYVKCARCGHQWRVSPDMPLDEEAGTLGAHHNIMEDEQPSVSSAGVGGMATETAQSSMPFPPPPPDAPSNEFSNWETRREFHDFAVSSMQNEQQDEANAGDNSETAMLDSNSLKNSWMDFDADNASSHSQGDGFSDTTQNGGFGDDNADWTHSLQEQPWNNVGEQGSENPELAIRSALSTALEHQAHEHQAHTHEGQEQEASAVEEEPFNEFWEGFAAERDDADLKSDAPAYGDKDLKTVAAELQDARRNSVIFDAEATGDGFSDDDGQYANNADAMADLALQKNMAEALRAAGSQDDGPYGRKISVSFDEGEQRGDEFHYGAEYIDNDSAALRNQLENIEHMPYEEPRRSGGLATVAAWAVFLSIASGFVLALVNFRGEVVTALPGTAGLYQMAGFSDVGHPIDFSNVSYRWTQSQGKPMVEVTGQVINRTDQTIAVPQVLIKMRDSSNSDLVNTTASIQTRELASQKSADFSIELAVSKTVSQIELEFDKLR